MSNLNSEKALCGVHCVVSSCIHHTESNECLASKINVGGRSATSAYETDCETFKKKSY